MDRNPDLLYKTLVVGVIVLFIGVGIQPAFADVSNISKSESNENCDICPSIEDLVDNEDVKKYQKLLDKINSLKEEDEELNSNTPLCDWIYEITNKWPFFLYPWGEFMLRFWENGYKIIWFIGMIPIIISALIISPLFTYYIYFCDYNPP